MFSLVVANGSQGSRYIPETARRVQEWGDNEGTVCAVGYADGSRGWIDWIDLATFCFEQGSPEIRAVVSAAPPRPGVVEDVFRRSVLPLAVQAVGGEALHASAVAMPSGIVGFCALSETGKSTVAYALSRLGYEQWADDALFFEPGPPILARRRPFKVRLRPEPAAYFSERGERPMDAPASRPGQAESRDTLSPIAALFVLKRVDAERGAPCKIVSVPAEQAFAAVLTHAYCFNATEAAAKRRIVADYLSLAANVPVYQIEYRSGLRHLPCVIDAILETMNEPAAAGAMAR